MSHHSPLREDKTCLNCRHVVEKRYCPNCGQENTTTRKTFHHLFVHFFEDLTHYENAFWKTIRHLMFKPGRLTREYLSGRRLSYLAPVRLYIFISFVTFFLIGVLPDFDETNVNFQDGLKTGLATAKENEREASEGKTDTSNVKHVTADEAFQAAKDSLDVRELDDFGKFSSTREFDSIQKSLPEHRKLKGLKHSLERLMVRIREKTHEEHFTEKFTEALIHNIPKALFLYMPIFAFWLWVFHGKKRWYYFDHGIFTLHYFSFLLLTFCLMEVINCVSEYLDFTPLSILCGFLWMFLFCWWFFYFFRSHSRFYGEHKVISRLKSLALYVINMTLISIFTLILLLYTVLYMH